MRVAVVGAAESLGGSLAASFVRGARDAGHSAELVAARTLIEGSGLVIRARRAGADALPTRVLEARLTRALAAVEPELVLVVKGRFLKRSAIARLQRRLDCPVVNYYPDDPYAPEFTEPQIVDALPAYDEVVTWAPHIADALERHGVARARVVPFGYDPTLYHRPPEPLAPRWDVALVGQHYPVRREYAEALADHELFVTGRGWTSSTRNGPLAGRVAEAALSSAETCRVYWQSRLALNVLHAVNLPAHNMRSFEIPASGTAMAATRTPEHERLFGDDGAVLVESAAEMRERVRALLAAPDELQAIAARGSERVATHTYAARMRALLAAWAG